MIATAPGYQVAQLLDFKTGKVFYREESDNRNFWIFELSSLYSFKKQKTLGQYSSFEERSYEIKEEFLLKARLIYQLTP